MERTATTTSTRTKTRRSTTGDGGISRRSTDQKGDGHPGEGTRDGDAVLSPNGYKAAVGRKNIDGKFCANLLYTP